MSRRRASEQLLVELLEDGPLTVGELRRRVAGRFAERTIRLGLERLAGDGLLVAAKGRNPALSLSGNAGNALPQRCRNEAAKIAAALPQGGKGGTGETLRLSSSVLISKAAAAAASQDEEHGGNEAATKRQRSGNEAATAATETVTRALEVVVDLVARLEEQRDENAALRRELEELRGRTSPEGRVDELPADRREVIHRDVKPANVLAVTPDEEIAIAERAAQKRDEGDPARSMVWLRQTVMNDCRSDPVKLELLKAAAAERADREAAKKRAQESERDRLATARVEAEVQASRARALDDWSAVDPKSVTPPPRSRPIGARA